jgi:GH15 family glucan-1,4-alpha-glucosidase
MRRRDTEHRHSPAIADYGIIGNGQTVALVSRGGSIDWCCWPRFDSPAVFCRLLDRDRGGFFRVEPVASYETSRSYASSTNVLVTTFRTSAGDVQVTDFMPAPSGASETEEGRAFPHRILRKVEGTAGNVELEVEMRPSFDYARASATFEIRPEGALARHADEVLSLVSPVALHQRDEALRARVSIAHGECAWFSLTHAPADRAREGLNISRADVESQLQRTLDYWTRWSAVCQYEGPHRDLVVRSALVLKLLIFEPSGALVAAPTTSLPETIGGVRNWDYRYTWLRDSGLMLDMLQQLGYHEESLRFIDWLQGLDQDAKGHLRIMWSVGGKPVPREQLLEHLSGYKNSRPVRIGNNAADQVQQDAEGHVIDAVVLCLERMPRPIKPELWKLMQYFADRTAHTWQRPDHGPWEMRGEPQHYLYSKLYCWVALDRALRFAENGGLDADKDLWRKERDLVRAEILTRGYCEEQGAFTQSFGSKVLDASALTIPLVGFLPASDPRVRSTTERIQRELGRNGLLYRYLVDDGLSGQEGTFTLCTLWLVSNLAQAGKIDEARSLMERVCSYANDLGLLAEEIDPKTGELLGNFPQGFTHLGLVRAALHIAEAEKHGRTPTGA